MREEKPYLDDELSLNELAGRLKIPGHHFSMVINIELGKNFFHFISSYRVEEAKRLLSDLKSEDITILKIAFESGFQSKAAFNKAFKEETGFTPTEYRNKF
jgi:AraC-like DNA-binding protein